MVTGCYSDVSPGSPEAVSGRLVELVQDQSPDIRRTAVEALGKIGQPSRALILARMLNDPDPHVLRRVRSQLDGYRIHRWIKSGSSRRLPTHRRQ